MNILIVKNIPSPYRNALFNSMNEVFKENGINLEVWYLAEREPNRHWKLDKEDFKYKYRIISGLHFKLSNMFVHLNPGVIKLLFSKKYDIVIFGGIGTPSLWMVPFLTRAHTKLIMWSESNLTTVKHSFKLAAGIKRMIFDRPHGFAVPGNKAKEYILSISEKAKSKSFFHLPNLIDENLYSLKVSELRKEKANLRKKYLGDDQVKNLWFISAQLIPKKGIDVFLEKINVGPYTKIIIAGSGPLKEKIEKIASAREINILLAGNLQQSEMLELYAIADVFVLPSLNDPSPLSVIEAIAAGLPILVSDKLGNHEEVFGHGSNGWSFNPHCDAEQLNEIISQVVNADRNRMDEMGRNSRKIYMENFSTRKILNGLAVQFKAFKNGVDH